jgi:hypothetical protein
MVAAWRALWSAQPGTTPAALPFGTVLLAEGTDGGRAGNFQNIVRAQTASFGALPNAAIPPPAFFASALDLADPWMDINDADRCAGGRSEPRSERSGGGYQGERGEPQERAMRLAIVLEVMREH